MASFRHARAACLAIALASVPALAGGGQVTAAAPTGRQISERITAKVGATAPAGTVDSFKAGDPDTPVTGIATTIEYVADAIAAGMRKALIVPGHVPSEQPGMDECATWPRSFIPEVPVRLVPTREPWTAIP